MEAVVLVMILLVCFNFVLKQTYRKPWAMLVAAAVCALFVVLAWPYAIEQSKSQLHDWLNNPQLMLDTAVVLFIEVVIQMAYCLMAVHLMNTGQVSKRTLYIYKTLRWFPGVLIFPVLFHIETLCMFTFTGTDFKAIAYTLAAAVLIAIPLLTLAIRWLIPEKELRLEIFFLSNALIAILGIIATVNGRTAVAGISEVNWVALAGMAALTLLFALAGLIIYLYKAYPSGTAHRTPRVHHTVPEGYTSPETEKNQTHS